MISIFSRSLLLLLAGLLIGAGSLAPTTAQAQGDYPNGPVTIVLPFGPGGSTDPLARLLADHLSQAFGQPVVVDNRPGGGTVIGTDAAAKAAPDGHTLLYTASSHVLNHLLRDDLPYDSLEDFQPVASIVRSEFILAVHPSVPADNLEEFIELAKSDTDGIDYAISGIGNPNHLAGEYFAMLTGSHLNSVPYSGGGPAIVDLLGGHVQAMFSVPTAVAEHIRAGNLKALARTGGLPLEGVSIPTFAEAGLPGYEIGSWNGVLVPAGTPRPIVDRLSSEIKNVLEKPEVVETLAAQGQAPWYLDADQFSEHINSDIEMFGSIIEAANIELE